MVQGLSPGAPALTCAEACSDPLVALLKPMTSLGFGLLLMVIQLYKRVDHPMAQNGLLNLQF